jgi:hypothetical protein
MAGHFESLGVPVDTEEQFGESMSTAAASAVHRPGSDGTSVLVAQDGSGARIALTLNASGSIVCVTPSFQSTEPMTVEVTGFADSDCEFETPLLADMLGPDGVPCYPIAVQIEDLAASRPVFETGLRLRIVVAGFIESGELFDSEADYLAGGTQMAVESMIPMGTFPVSGEEDGFVVTPRVLMSGRVLESEVRTNQTFGRRFARLRVQSVCHTFDVLAEPALLEGSSSPTVLRGSLWLSGRLAPDQVL